MKCELTDLAVAKSAVIQSNPVFQIPLPSIQLIVTDNVKKSVVRRR